MEEYLRAEPPPARPKRTDRVRLRPGIPGGLKMRPLNSKRPAEAGLLVRPVFPVVGNGASPRRRRLLLFPPVPFVPAFLQVAHE